MAAEVPLAIVVRVRTTEVNGPNPWYSCSGTLFNSFVLVPLGVFGSFQRRFVTASDSPLQIECAFSPSESWRPARVNAIIPLWKGCTNVFENILSSDVVASPVSIGSAILEHQRDAIVLAGTLVALRVEGGVPEEPHLKPSVDKEDLDLSIGDTVDIFGCPYPSLLGRKFMISRFKAFISCVLYGTTLQYKGPMLYLLDAQGCVPGTEGASIVKNNMVTCGCLGYAITSPSIGASFHVGWPLRYVTHVLRRDMGYMLPFSKVHGIVRDPFRHVIALTVSVHPRTLGNNTAWASGFIIAPTVVVTNAHVLDGQASHDLMLTIRCSQGIQHKATLKHSFGGIIDLVFLDVPTLPSSLHYSEMRHATPTIGHDVIICGFPLWNPSVSMQAWQPPKLTSGIVTGTLSDTRGVAAFMTNAQVINGASGGPVIDVSSMSLVGLACSNARVVTKDQMHGKKIQRIFPTLNFCIPSRCIRMAYDGLYAVNNAKKVNVERAFLQQRTHHVWQGIDKCSDTALSPKSKL